MVVDGGVTRQCTRGIGQEMCSSLEIRSSYVVEHEHQQLESIAGVLKVSLLARAWW